VARHHGHEGCLPQLSQSSLRQTNAVISLKNHPSNSVAKKYLAELLGVEEKQSFL